MQEHLNGIEAALDEVRGYFRSVAEAPDGLAPALADALTKLARQDAVTLERACCAWNTAVSASDDAVQLAVGAEALRRHLDSLVVALIADGGSYAVATQCRANCAAKLDHCAALSETAARMASAAGVHADGDAAETDESSDGNMSGMSDFLSNSDDSEDD